ncbi:hypothetical protein HAZT_HAZT000170, partial [Hyalella azteca]
MVSGVSGYVASHIVKLLQESGYRVRGTVRSLKDAARIAPLTQLAKNPKHGLELVEADLVRDDGWDKAMEGVYAVMHTASPFPPIGADVKEEAIFRPAIEGTRRVLAAAANAGVKKVVVTSSIIAVVGTAFVVDISVRNVALAHLKVDISVRNVALAHLKVSISVRDVALAHLKCLTNPGAVALFDQGVRMEVLPRLDEILELDTSR